MATIPELPGPGIDTWDQPLVDAWFTPGFTAQNFAYNVAHGYGLTGTGWPKDVPYAHITHRFGDSAGNPLGGFLTFVPSDSVRYTESGITWTLPPRPAGITPWPVSWNGGYQGSMMDSGRIYLQGGFLNVYEICTDASGLVTTSGNPLTYLVTEHWLGGMQYQITTPAASPDPVDLNDLIIQETIVPYAFDPRQPLAVIATAPEPVDSNTLDNSLSSMSIVFGSTEYVTINVSIQLPGLGVDSPLDDAVFIAIMGNDDYPGDSDWIAAQWLTQSAPYQAGVLEGSSDDAVVGPLAVGTYKVWLKLVDSPEVPIIRAGTLYIT